MREKERFPILGPLMISVLWLLPATLLAQKLDRGIRGIQDHEVFVRMADQLFITAVDYPTFCRENAATPRSHLRTSVIADLRSKADASWKLVKSVVKTLEDDGSIRDLKRYFVVNGFACMASTEACKKLAKLQAVGFVYRKPVRSLPALTQRSFRRRPGVRQKKLMQEAMEMWDAGAQQTFNPEQVSPPWNLKRIQANQAWKEGATGKGIIIALLDTGIHITPPLITALWRNEKEKLNGRDDDGNGYVDDIFGWNFQQQSNFVVTDQRGHGSMCGGIMAGRPVDTGKKKIVTGIAPEARLMMLRGMGYIEAYEYALANGASVLSMSYMWVRRPLATGVASTGWPTST